MATTSITQPSSLELIQRSYTETIESFDSVVSLAEYLAGLDFISMETVDRLNLLEGEGSAGLVEAKEVLINILMSLGVVKFAEVKKSIREYSKLTKSESATVAIPHTVTSPLPKPVPRSYKSPSPEPKENGLECKEGVSSNPKEKVERHHRHRGHDKSSRKQLTTEMESFAVFFFTLMQKLTSYYEKSNTLKSRLTWFHQDVPSYAISRYFPHYVLRDLHDVTSDTITISVETLMESFKQLWEAQQDGGREKRKENDQEREKSKEIDRLTKELVTMKEVLQMKERELKEIHEINNQWMLECSDLKQEITRVQNQDGKDAMLEEEIKDDDIVIVQNGNQEQQKPTKQERESLLLKLTEAYQKTSELEFCIQNTVSREECLLLEGTETKQQLEEMTSECEVLRAKIQALEDEQQQLKETNEAILLEMESLRKESEDDKNHIEELKDRVGNLKLNMKSKEPTAREMAHLLETNRTLDNKIKELENVLEAIQNDKDDLYDKLQTVQKEKELIQKELESVKDELVAYQTHIKELELGHGQKTFHQTKPSHTHTPASPRSTNQPFNNKRDNPFDSNMEGYMSFRSKQRQCPMCNHVFMTLSEQEFTGHVANCFQ